MQKPLLYKFKKLCNATKLNSYTYDKVTEMLVSNENGLKVPAIWSHSLGTKKENLEKGEDEGPSLFL